MAKSPEKVNLIPTEATSENFGDYGQIIEASSDGVPFGPNDAQLDLSRGIPRYPLRSLYQNQSVICCLVIFVPYGFVDQFQIKTKI